MNKAAQISTSDALRELTAGILPPIARRIMKAYYLGAGEAFEIAKTLKNEAKQAGERPTSLDPDLPALLRVKAD